MTTETLITKTLTQGAHAGKTMEIKLSSPDFDLGMFKGPLAVFVDGKIVKAGHIERAQVETMGLNYVVAQAAMVTDAEGELIVGRIEQMRIDLRAELELNLPGLALLEAAADDEMRYAEQFDRMMDDEDNDGARPPKSVKVAYSDLAKQYPRAALYLKAESYELAANYAKANAGDRAAKLLASGGEMEDAREILRTWNKDAYLD
jgi:hypothetical protein